MTVTQSSEELLRDLECLRDQLADIEQQHAHLTCLYVACSRLHATLDRDEVLAAIQEIVINLVGCEELAIFERDGDTLALISSFGVDAERFHAIPAAPYLERRAGFSPPPSSDASLTAAIPLTVNDRVTGAILLFRLLPHKHGLEPIDFDLFELLATHAATALHATAPCTV